MTPYQYIDLLFTLALIIGIIYLYKKQKKSLKKLSEFYSKINQLRSDKGLLQVEKRNLEKRIAIYEH